MRGSAGARLTGCVGARLGWYEAVTSFGDDDFSKFWYPSGCIQVTAGSDSPIIPYAHFLTSTFP